MTSPTSSTEPATSGSPTPQLAAGAISAAQRALGTEHAAGWCYSFAAAFVGGNSAAAVLDGASAHQARRDSIERLIKDAGTDPVPARPTYAPPKPVTDAVSAEVLLATAESDCAQAWRSLLENTDDADLRRTALDALTASAVRGTRWRLATRERPATVAFPGQP